MFLLVFVGKNSDAVCVNGSWGGCCPLNHISINIGGQLVLGLQTLSTLFASFPDGSRPLLFTVATPAASKHLHGDEHIPRVRYREKSA